VTSSRKIVAYIATSADGFIARPDHSVDWLERPKIKGDYGLGAFGKTIDTILWGRKTYEVALGFGEATAPGGPALPKARNYVFTQGSAFPPAPNVEFVHMPVETFARRLRARPGKNIWIMGGARLIASFLDAGEIDELIVHVIPTLIGEGIPLLAPRHRTVPLQLLHTKRFADGVVKLHYQVSLA
jgi:dihydrofolate reductase